MGLLKHGQEQDRTQQFDPSHSKAIPLRHKLRRLLGKKRSGSVESCVDSQTPSNHTDATTTQSLWDRAYNRLRENESKLVGEYEKLLSKYTQETVAGSNEGLARAVPLEDLSRGTNRPSGQDKLKRIIAVGLQRMKENETKYTIAGHEFNLSNKIEKAANLVLWAKDFVGEAVKVSPEASIAWAGVCIILPLLTNPRIADEANSDGFAYVTTRMQYYTGLEPLLQRLGSNAEVSPALMMEANNQIVQLYHYILEFQIQSVLRFYQNRPRRYASDMILTTDWKKMVDKIKEFEGMVDKTLTQVHQLIDTRELESLRNKSEESLQFMRHLLSDSQRQIHLATEQRDIARRGLDIQEDKVKQKLSDRHNECLQLFRLADSKKDVSYEWYKERVEDRVKGTCEWFLKHENFQKWLEQDSGPLLVSADPGCGKSVLAKYLVDHGLPYSLPHPSTICYFFFKDQDQNTGRQALCALLHQLFSQKPFLIEHAMRQFQKDGKNLIITTSSLWTVLKDAVGDPQAGHIIIVLDALDECAESEFEDLMSNIQYQFHKNQLNHNRLRYLLTSRPYEQIVSKFQHFLEKFPNVRIPGEEESETISQEINQVINYRVDKLAKEKQLTVQIKDHLAEKLLAIPHRTYLWVYLVFDYLGKEIFKKTARAIDSIIAILPKNIYQAYENILSKSKEEDPFVRRALSVIIAATRPLTIAEMNVALNVDYTSKSLDDLDLEEEEDFKSRLRSLCGLFISVHNRRVYFLHQTAREFLLGHPLPASIPLGHWQHSISSRDAQRVLAEICIIYLDILDYDEIPTDVNSYTFLDYSAKNWSTHFVEACVCQDSDIIIPFVLRICDHNSKTRSTWLKIYWDTYVRRNLPTPLSDLALSSHLGLDVVVRVLLEQGADIESRDDDGWGFTPLFRAVENRHEGVVKLLLDANADIEAKENTIGGTPVSLAATMGQVRILELLLENNGDSEARDRMMGQTPLIWAVQQGHEGSIKTLLDNNADIEANTEFGWTSVCFAAEQGLEGVVKLFLDRNAEINYTEEMNGQLPLFHALWKNHTGVVKLMLDKGVEFEYQAYSRAVLAAAHLGHTEILGMLLQKDANLDFAEPMFDPDKDSKIAGSSLHNGYTPLLWVVHGGFKEGVRLLLEKGANTEAQSAEGETALLLAARLRDREDCVKMLLEKGANVEFRSAKGETALSLATAHDNEETVRILLEMGADPTSSIGFSTLVPVAHIPRLKHLQST